VGFFDGEAIAEVVRFDSSSGNPPKERPWERGRLTGALALEEALGEISGSEVRRLSAKLNRFMWIRKGLGVS